jgi:hypothetical protein
MPSTKQMTSMVFFFVLEWKIKFFLVADLNVARQSNVRRIQARLRGSAAFARLFKVLDTRKCCAKCGIATFFVLMAAETSRSNQIFKTRLIKHKKRAPPEEYVGGLAGWPKWVLRAYKRHVQKGCFRNDFLYFGDCSKYFLRDKRSRRQVVRHVPITACG